MLENSSEHLKNRVKRGFWPWDAEDSKTEGTTVKPVDFFDLFNSNTEDKTTTKSPEVEKPAEMVDRRSHEQNEEYDSTNEEDDVDEGSGSYNNEVTDSYCEFQLFDIYLLILKRNNLNVCMYIPSLVRLKFKVVGVWSPDFETQNSDAYQKTGQEIARKLEELYDQEKTTSSNKIRARVVQIR